MYPYARIIVAGEDITAKLNNRNCSIVLNDFMGLSTDTISISFDDRDPFIEIPPKGEKLDVMMGYLPMMNHAVPFDGLKNMGKFKINEITVSKGAGGRRMTITGNGIDMRGGFKKSRTGSYQGKTVKQIVEEVGKRYGYQVKVSGKSSEHFIVYINQANESDFAFLTRLSGMYSADTKVSNDVLYWTDRYDLYTIMPPEQVVLGTVPLLETDTTEWTWHTQGRASHNEVWGVSYNKDLALRTKKVSNNANGDKDAPPASHTIADTYTTADDAQAAANSRQSQFDHSNDSFSATTIGNPKLTASTLITLQGFRKDIPTEWTIIETTHTIDDGGYSTELTAHRKKVKKST